MQRDPKIGILVVAYNAATTLAGVLDRIPESFRSRVSEVFVCDDASQDATYLVGLGYKALSDMPITVIRHPQNLGYGGNQKIGYQLAIDHGLDIIVLLHGDGQYAPECIETLVAPLASGEAHAVFGSRMMVRGDALKGGMPVYKYMGNRVLTTFQNWAIGTQLSEFHSGYRAYSVEALASIPFHANSNDFDFDTEIILQLVHAGRRIVEVPIPTYYGDEICYVNGMKYAKDVVADVLRYRLNSMGFGGGASFDQGGDYDLKESEDSSHGQLEAWMERFPPSDVLDLGCAHGRVGGRLRKMGHHVTGVELMPNADAEHALDRFLVADLEQGLPPELDGSFDVVLAADVLEHVRDPARLLREIRDVVAPGGSLLISVPNFGHWYARMRVVTGTFDYDERGILDRGHLRFFSRRSFRRLLLDTGWRVSRVDYTGLPIEALSEGDVGLLGRLLRAADRVLVRLWPTMFGYQMLFQAHPVEEERTEEIHLQDALSAAANAVRNAG
jgi:glycosyltransferase involved in cell wall biosynthesis